MIVTEERTVEIMIKSKIGFANRIDENSFFCKALAFGTAMIALLGWYHFLYLIPFPSVVNKILQIHVVVFMEAVCGILFSLYCLVMYKKTLLSANHFRWLYTYIPVLIITFVVEWIGSVIRYPGLGVMKSFRFGCNFLMVGLIPAVFVLFKILGSDGVFKILDYFSFVWNIVLIVQACYYKYCGRILFGLQSYFDYYTKGRIDTRFGLRVLMGCMGVYIIYYNLSDLYDSDLALGKKLFSLFRAVVGICCLLFVQQSRLALVYFGFSLAVMLLINNKTSRQRKIELITVLAAAIILLGTGVIQNLISKMLLVEKMNGGVSLSARLYEIRYYLGCWLKNPILGNGFTIGKESSALYAVEHGELGTAYYSDIGLIGLLAETGLLSVVFFLFPMYQGFQLIRKIRKQNGIPQKETIFAMTGYSYLVISSISEIVTDNERSIMFPLMLAYFMYLVYRAQPTDENG